MHNPPEHRARKRFGQNFLQDQAVINRILEVIDPSTDDNLVEIGPGQGAITTLLLDKSKKIHAVELDRDLIPLLEKKCGAHGDITIHNVDALKFDFKSLAGDQKIRLVGNLPYNISTPILFHLLSQQYAIKDMHFMLQKEVVERMAASPGSKTRGRLSVMIQAQCAVTSLFTIPPTAFDPAPKVDSAFVRLEPFEKPRFEINDMQVFAKLVKQAFSQKRKTLRNNLKKWITDAQFETAAIQPGLRAEALQTEDFARLSNLVNEF